MTLLIFLLCIGGFVAGVLILSRAMRDDGQRAERACPNCGAGHRRRAKFCPKCGAALGDRGS